MWSAHAAIDDGKGNLKSAIRLATFPAQQGAEAIRLNPTERTRLQSFEPRIWIDEPQYGNIVIHWPLGIKIRMNAPLHDEMRFAKNNGRS